MVLTQKKKQRLFKKISSPYAALTSCKKLDALICNKTLKTHFGHFSAQNPHYKNFLQKTIRANFKPLCCCNFIQKIKTVTCTDFSKKLRRFILGPFGAPFDLKTSKQNFPPKII